MVIQRTLAILALFGLAACSLGTHSSVAPTASVPSSRGATPLAIRYGTQTLVLAADRENLPSGAIARIVGLGAYGTVPVFQFFVSVPQAPSTPVKILGITSDASARIYLSFTADASSPAYGSGAVAIFNTVPATGSKQNPDELMTPSGAKITPPAVPVSGQLLAVDSSGKIYALYYDWTEGRAHIAVYPALPNGPTQPLAELGYCFDTTSVAIGPSQNVYIGCVIAADVLPPYPASNSIIGTWYSRYSQYVAWLVTTTPDGRVYAAEQAPFADHPEVVPRIDVFPPNPFGSPPDFAPPPALREIVGDAAGIGYPVAIAACPHGEIFVAQTPSLRFPNARIGVLEFGPTSTGNVAPFRTYLAGDKTIAAIGF